MDTAGNLLELHRFAWENGLKEVTFVLCTGNPFYDKRLLAEWILMLKEPAFADIKINLVLAHCPLFLGSSVPEGKFQKFSSVMRPLNRPADERHDFFRL